MHIDGRRMWRRCPYDISPRHRLLPSQCMSQNTKVIAQTPIVGISESHSTFFPSAEFFIISSIHTSLIISSNPSCRPKIDLIIRKNSFDLPETCRQLPRRLSMIKMQSYLSDLSRTVFFTSRTTKLPVRSLSSSSFKTLW